MKEPFIKATKRFVREMPERRSEHMRRLLPNAVTIIALCIGMTAIRFAFLACWKEAILCVVCASVLDGMDGRLARFLGSSSEFGAELDSLSDFLCFGVAPAFILYFFGLQQWEDTGWIFCLFFSTCTALRLARFNVHRILPKKLSWGEDFFVGVPAPAGAMVALLPLLLKLASIKLPYPPLGSAVMLVAAGFLMLSRVPTLSIKNRSISPKKMPFVLLLIAVLLGQGLRTPWLTLAILTCLYALSIPLSFLYVRSLRKRA